MKKGAGCGLLFWGVIISFFCLPVVGIPLIIVGILLMVLWDSTPDK
jgi:hypothetical protein